MSDNFECHRILKDVKRLEHHSGQTIAFIGRLGEELDKFSSICSERDCSSCPVSLVRNGVKGLKLTARETVISVVSSALLVLIDREPEQDQNVTMADQAS